MVEAWALALREFRSFLRSPLGYVLLAVHALAAGLIFVTLLFLMREQLVASAQESARSLRPAAVSVQLAVVTPYFINVASQLLFVIPFVTMRSFAEERRSGRLQLLASYPLHVWQLVVGKYLGVLLFALLLIGISVLHAGILIAVSTPIGGPLIGALLGLLLMTMALLAIGLFVSALAQGQVEAAVLTLGLFLMLAMAGGVLRAGSAWYQTVIANLSPLYQYTGFGQGLFSWSAVLYFVAVTVFFVALSARGVDLIKWRG